MTILITTATGQVGSAAARVLVAKGHEVRAGSRDPAKVAISGAHPTRFDFGDPSSFDAALEGTTAALLVAPTGTLDAAALLGPFVEHAARRGVRIVTMTASGVEHSEAIPLRKLELLAERGGSPFAHLRPSWFSQNFAMYWLAPILRDGVIALPAADARTTFIDARDIGEAAAVVLANPSHDGKAYTLTGPEALTYAEAAGRLAQASGRPVRYVPIDDAAFVEGAIAAGLPRDYAEMLATIFGAVRAGAASVVDPALAQLLGRAPTTLAAYAREHAHVWRRA